MELDREIVASAKRGDPQSQEELVRILAPLVFRLASRFFRSRDDVEDLAQEAFSRFFLKIDQVQPDANVAGWVSRLTVNVCYDRLRKLQREKAAMESYLAEPREKTPHIAYPDIAYEDVAYEDVRSAVDQLDPKFRIPLLLKEVEDLSVQEISNIMGLSQANVKVRLYRARKRLASLLPDRAEQGPRRSARLNSQRTVKPTERDEA